MDRADDLIEYFKLETQILPDYTRHVVRRSDARKRRDWEMEEIWTRRKQLGKGGSGTVWLEETRGNTHKMRAVKELVKKDARVDFKRELLAIAKFSKYTDLFATFFGWYESPDAIFIAMEYFKLGDLGSCLDASLPELDAKRIARQLLIGVSIMHEAGFAHRDLKPQNVFVVSTSPVWLVKIGDFGISKRNYNDETDFRTRIFTAAYSAPELFYYVNEDAESDAYDNAVDLWSLGCLIFRVLTGTVPFPDLKSLKDFCQEKLAFPSAKLEGCRVSPTGTGFVRSLLAPVPSHRPTAIKALKAVWLELGEHAEASTVVRTTIAHPASTHAISNHSIECRDHAYIIDREDNRWSELYERLSFLGTQSSGQSSHESDADQRRQGTTNGYPDSGITRKLSPQHSKCSIIEPQHPAVSQKSRETSKEPPAVRKANINYKRPEVHGELEIGERRYQNTNNRSSSKTGTADEDSISCQHPRMADRNPGVSEQLNVEEHQRQKPHNRLSSRTDLTDDDSNSFEKSSVGHIGLAHRSTDDMSARDKKYLISCLKAAIQIENLERVNLAIGHPPRINIINIQDEKGQTPLHWAIQADPQGQCSIAKLLLHNRADTSIKDNRGRTALFLAAKLGYAEVLKLLLEYGADTNVTNIPDQKGQTALGIAVKYGHDGIVKDLLMSRADVNVKDFEGRTPLLNAVLSGHQYYHITGTGHKYHRVIDYKGPTARLERIIHLLLEHGAEVHTHSKRYETPLHLAVQYESTSIARSLIDNGADVNHIPQCSICGYSPDDTPLKRAVVKSRDENVKLLLRHGALVPDDWKFRTRVSVSALWKGTKKELADAREGQKLVAILNGSTTQSTT